jgi:hypothetical protein
VLEPWIIEQIRRREEEERRRQERPRLDIPLRDDRDRWKPEHEETDEEEDREKSDRGVLIIDI